MGFFDMFGGIFVAMCKIMTSKEKDYNSHMQQLSEQAIIGNIDKKLEEINEYDSIKTEHSIEKTDNDDNNN